jgi:nucleotide-binding universal stress UspA family protein
MKTLLIPTDFSETAKDAFKYAIRLAQHINANLKVVNVYHEDMLNTYTTPAMIMTQTVEMGRFIREDLKKFTTIEKSRSIGLLPPIETACYDYAGEVGNKIIELSKSEDIDIVVMGSTGEYHTADKWFGTVSTYVAQEAYCPVLLIPHGTVYRKPKRLLFAHNLDEPTHVATLERVAFIAKCLDAKVHNVFVELPDKKKEEVGKLVNREWNLFESERFDFKTSVVKHHSILDAIESYATAHKMDMLMVSTHHRPFLEKIFHESLTKDMALENQLPMLVLHLEDKFSMF